MDTKKIVANILKAEKEAGVFNIKHKKTNVIWPFYRMYFFSSFLSQKTNIDQQGASAKRINLSSILKYFKLLNNSHLFQLFVPARKNNIIISSQRYVNETEIYTYNIKKVLAGDFLEWSFSNRFQFHKGPIYLDSVKIALKIISKISFHFFRVPKEINNFFLKVEANSSFKNQYRRYRIEYSCWYAFYRLIIKIQRPKKFFLVGGVYYTPLIAIAEKNNIEVVEIQHGVINQYHLAYHFPGQNRKTFFPNKLLLFSDYWKSKAFYPIGTELIAVGNDYYYSGTNFTKKNHSILIIGSPMQYADLISFIRLNMDFFVKNNYKIIYKLHPKEVPSWRNTYRSLKELNDLKKIRVVAYDPPISYLLENCEIVIGVNSTSIYESVDRKCKTFVLDLQSSEYFDDLVEKKIVKKLLHNIPLTKQDLNFQPEASVKFFDPSNLDKIKEIIIS